MKCYRLIIFFIFPAIAIAVNGQIMNSSEAFKLDIGSDFVSKELKKSFSKSDSIILDSNQPIEGFALSGKIVQLCRDSFVRILLADKDGKEYIVLETSRIFNDMDTIVLSDYCEETKMLDAVFPAALHIYINNALVEINHATLKRSIENTTSSLVQKDVGLKEYAKIRWEQVQNIVDRINLNNQEHKRLWRAGVTDLSLMPWESRKRILGIDGNCYPTGFEYYYSGIFELGENSTDAVSSSSSPYVDSFDWRNRHGKNWMSPVKHQSTGSSCWAFTAIGVTEALVNLYFNNKIDYDLSEQEVISCSKCGSNASGGFEGCALKWIANNGVSEEASFPFSNSDEPCGNKGNFSELISPNTVSYVPNHTTNNNDEVKKALIKYGPLASGYMYDNDTYHGHAMVIVGYATLHVGDTIRYFSNYYQAPVFFDVIQAGDSRIGKTYWIYKNSYGTYNDHAGYAYVLYNDQSCFRTPYYATTPISSLIYSDADINVTDEDGDGYYY